MYIYHICICVCLCVCVYIVDRLIEIWEVTFEISFCIHVQYTIVNKYLSVVQHLKCFTDRHEIKPRCKEICKIFKQYSFTHSKIVTTSFTVMRPSQLRAEVGGQLDFLPIS